MARPGPGIGIKITKQTKNSDGTSTVTLSNGKTLNTSSEEYKNLYDKGFLYGEDPQGRVYLTPNANPEMEKYNEFVNQYSFEDYMRPYFEGTSGAIARGSGQSFDRYWEVPESYKQNYDQEINKRYIKDFFERNPQQGEEERGAYLDRITDSLPYYSAEYIMDNLPSNQQPTIWDNFSTGVDFLTENPFSKGNDDLFNKIEQNTSLSGYEKDKAYTEIEDNPNLSRLINGSKILSPLSLPAKVVQSSYRGEYNLEDALMGKQNNASLLEDVATDPLTYLGISEGQNILKGANKYFPVVDKLKALKNSEQFKNTTKSVKNLAEEHGVKLFNPKLNAKREAALKKGQDFNEMWYNDPATHAKIDKFIKAAEGKVELGPDEEFWRGVKTSIAKKDYRTDFPSTQAQIDDLITGSKPFFGDPGHGGTSYGKNYIRDKYAKPDAYGRNQNFVNKNQPTQSIDGSAVHEGNHGAMNPNEMDVAYFSSAMKKPFQDYYKYMESHNVDNNLSEYISYMKEPSEIYARLMEFRNKAGMKPSDIIQKGEMGSLIKKAVKDGGIDHVFFGAANQEKLRRLLNALPVVGAGTAAATPLFYNKDTEKNNGQ